MPEPLPDEQFHEVRIISQERGCAPVIRRTGVGGEGEALAYLLATERRQHGGTASVYCRTWTPGPWVAVDPVDGGAGSVAATASPQGVVADPPRPPALNLGTGSTRQTRQSAERNATDEPTAVDPQPKED